MVLPYIDMNLPLVYMSSQSWTPLPPPSPYHLSGSSQCTSPKHPVSCIEPGLVIRFLYDIIHVSMPFSQIIPPSPSPTESKRLFCISLSLLLSHIQGYLYHLSKFHVYVLVYSIGVSLCIIHLNHSSILAWKIPWTEEPGRLQSMGSQRVGHDWATSLTHFQTQKGGPALGLAGLCRSRSSRAWHVCVSRYSLSGWHLSCLELPEYLLRKILPEKI